MVQGRPSMSDTVPPASVMRRLPAPAWRAEITSALGHHLVRRDTTLGDSQRSHHRFNGH